VLPAADVSTPSASVTDPNGRYDVAVVGAGIVGLAAARELLARRPGLRLIVLEREGDVAQHQTGSNSGVIHGGIYYKPGSLKARLCVSGARMLYAFCEEHGIAYERCGKVVVALSPGELARLDELEARGRANGVPGLRRVGPAELAELEPHATGVAALHSPQTGIVDFAAVARALADDVRAAGGTIATGSEVMGMHGERGHVRIRCAQGEIQVRRSLVCAGAWSDSLARRAGAAADPRIVPFRGAYLRLRPESRGLVRSLIYPVPDPELPFLGVHLTRRIDGDVWLGPTALMVGAPDAYRLSRIAPRSVGATLTWPGTWRMVRRHWRAGVSELRMGMSRRAFVRACSAYVPELREDDVRPGPAGVRAQAVGRDGALVDDFVVHEADGVQYVRNAPSPAATSSLAIAELLADGVERSLG
jgi:L-2-hydroxyglutarate oxidase